MLELEHNGFYPLTREHLTRYVPAQPGFYILAVRLVNGVHKSFFTSQSDNIYKSLQSIARKEWQHLPQIVRDYLEAYQCYFTFYVLLKSECTEDMKAILTDLSQPPDALNIVNCN